MANCFSTFAIISVILLSVCNISILMEEERWVYSVWAIPPEPVKERLEKVMEKLRDEFGAPAFEPHMTVVGAIRLTEKEALQKLKSACQGLKPYTVRVNTVARGSFFYQCVYLLVDPISEVVQASAHTCSHFGYKGSSSYMPHISLLYGDFTDEEKEKAKGLVKLQDPDVCSISFLVSRLTLYKTDTEDKTLRSWEKITDCDLTGSI